MSDHKENKHLPVALLAIGIGCIMILSCCFVWLVVRCERWRRRRKYRPKGGNRYSINASHIANGQELKDLQPRHLKPSVNLINYSVTSQSIPSLLSAADSMMDADSIASEPLYPSGRNYDGEDEPDFLPPHHRDLSIARILGSFPELPYYQSQSGGSSSENIAKRSTTVAPIPRPRSSNFSKPTAGSSKDLNINSYIYTEVEYKSESSIAGKAQDAASASSAESLKVEIPGGAIRARDMTGLFEFTKLRDKKNKTVTGNNSITVMGSNSITKSNSESATGNSSENSKSYNHTTSSVSNDQAISSKPTFETEV